MRAALIAAVLLAIPFDAHALRSPFVMRAIAGGGVPASPPPEDDCGDEVCDEGEGETCETCEVDCGACPPPDPECGDDECHESESCFSCAEDCGECAENAYDPYPDLDLATLPFELDEPTAPTPSGDPIEVDSAAEFNAAADTNGATVVVTGGWDGSNIAGVTADDVTVTINADVVIGGPIEIGGGANRVLIQGEAPGMGEDRPLVGQIRFTGAVSTDIVIDGLDTNGAAAIYGSDAENNQCFRQGPGSNPARVAIVNTRCIAAAYGWQLQASHVVFAGSSMYHGAATRDDAGQQEGWGIRNTAGPIVIFESDIRGTRYVQVRTHSLDAADEYLLIRDTTLVATAEGRSVWCWPNLGNSSGLGDGCWVQDSRLYAYSVGGEDCSLGPEIVTYQSHASEGTGNTYYSAGSVEWTPTFLGDIESGGGSPGPHSWCEGADCVDSDATFDEWDTQPAWGGAGDPTEIPMPGGLALIVGEGDCPGIVPP